MLELKDVIIDYNPRVSGSAAVSNISFFLEEGSVLGICGESGCGKSTIAKALLNILPSYAKVSGQIFFCGEDILSMEGTRRNLLRGKAISMVFQDPTMALNPIRKIKHQFYDILRESEVSKRDMDKRIFRDFEMVQLRDPKRVMESYPSQLSGGMRQRVVIAAALSNRPRLLICDEPTSALDASTRPIIIDELIRLKEENNLTVLYISHNLAELRRVCDDILEMKQVHT